MLVLGFLIAVAVIVFLSNAAPSKSTGGGGMPAVDVGSPQAAAAADMGSSTGGASTGGASTGGTTAGGETAAGAGALAAQTYAPASSSNKDTLKSGETLAEGASLTSKNGKYVFTYEYGAAIVKSGNFTMWTSPGNLTPGGVVKITNDGNIGIFPSQYSVTPTGWSSATAGQGTQPYSLVMKDDGRLLLFDSSPMVIWSAPVTMPPVGVDCLMGEWGEWSACSKNCGGGVQTRNRSIITPSNTGGKACGETAETRPCNTDPCPDCAFSWTPFGQCANSDPVTGKGKKQATLIVSSPSGPGGSVCPDPNSNIEDCVNCVFSPWNPAGELSAQACNQTTGIKSQSRTITVPASGGGTCTEPLNRQETCPVDCQLNPWPETWSACENKVNGVGKNTRTTTVKFQPKNGGKACTTASGVLSGTQTCDANGNCTETRTCGDCVLGTTYTYGNCDPATGRATRTRVGDVAASNGGNACPGVTDDVACDVDCQVSGWEGGGEGWSACDITSGKKTRSRTVTRDPKNNGKACPPLSETVNCDIDCKVGDWTDWSPAECGVADASRERSRKVTQDKKNNGTACPELNETEACPVVNCVQTAKVYSACNQTTGKKSWTRTTTTEPKNGGTACGPTSGEEDCPVDCKLGGREPDFDTGEFRGWRDKPEWGAWSACSKECNGTQYRDPNIIAQPKNGGAACPSRETQSCNTEADKCKVKLYSGCGHTGRQGAIPVGNYPGRATNPAGYGFQERGGVVGNDELRSIRVPSGLKATIFQDANYGGGRLGAWTISGSDPNSKNRDFCATDSWWRAEMSSIKVEYE